MNLSFNESLIHGGEDKELFLRLTACGGKIKWVNNAMVQENIVIERLTTKWALRRCFRMGATGFKIESCNKTFLGALLLAALKGLLIWRKVYFHFCRTLLVRSIHV
ncbi:hypothetical protein ACOBV8_16020 [Pseudoalteromonas espejiana]